MMKDQSEEKHYRLSICSIYKLAANIEMNYTKGVLIKNYVITTTT